VSIAALRACWSVDSFGSRARCSSFSLAQALEIALGIEPAVINLSLGGPHDPLLARLLAEAMRRGIVVVTADPGADGESFPASMPGVIVARGSPVLANGSRGHAFVAPASEILTTIPNSGYAFLSGSSLAAAHVSGVIALILERDASIGAQRIAQLLTDTMSFSLDGTSISACGALQRLTDTQICAVGADVASYSDLAND
jgi:subtilisin family serine protease